MSTWPGCKPWIRTEVVPSTRVSMSPAAASSGSILFHSSGDCSPVIKRSSDKTRPIPNRLDVFRYGNMMAAMARAATTSDAFNAIAEPQRRDILALLRAGERPVTDLAQELGMSQPRASKHLRVLREVGLVRVRGAGKQRLYGLDARGLRPVHEWVGGFERFWNESFDRLDTYVQDLKQTRQEE